MTTLQAARIQVTGLVQGVGFRPFVYHLAAQRGLLGWVRNTTGSVEIAVEGGPADLEAFVSGLRHEAPPLAQVGTVSVEPCPPSHFTSFEILSSARQPDAFQLVSPDVAICPDCLRELFDPADRRFHYPFINCTHCGPRFTLITDVPYDRLNTTMAGFPLCPACAAEYADPRNRRFHAQPVACPVCGPRVWLARASNLNGASTPEMTGLPAGGAALAAARACLAAGGIVAVKGLGGFHLACRADDEQAIRRLRARKQRGAKPLAIMVPDLTAAEALGDLDVDERAWLTSRERPIVLVRRSASAAVAASLAPGQAILGIMLPYTPLHYLLLEREDGFPTALVMTSGNHSGAPLITSNAEALEGLAGIADIFLLHNRDIQTRCDDSVLRVVPPAPAPAEPAKPAQPFTVMMRRARGFAPRPVALPWQSPPLLATGAELKNTFCLARGGLGFLSPHVGDLQNFETLQAFETGVAQMEALFRIRPEALAYDLHPDYLSSRYALARAEHEGLPAFAVQHHHAHIAAAMADAGLTGDQPVIGLACDGAGFGADGAIWGGEFLIADYAGYERASHLAYVPLPGGDGAVREPWRMALAWLSQAGLAWEADLAPVQFAVAEPTRGAAALAVVQRQLATGVNAPPTSSLGRLFDAVAALVGICQQATYEGQAAIEMEAAITPDDGPGYAFEIGRTEVEAAPVIAAVAADLRAGQPAGVVAARFHAGVAHMLLGVCQQLRRQSGLKTVVLGGGVWQNGALLRRTTQLLQADDFSVVSHRQAPANDGGLAMGQAAIAAAWLRRPAWPAGMPQPVQQIGA